jgi:uncharacterized membrane protein YeaQ/YmgE (transglycosylase-associated protein family)
MTFIIFMAFGAAVGWLLSQNNKGAGYGAVVDMSLAAVGGLIGGWLLGEIGIAGVIGFFAALIAAIVAAIILIAVVRVVKPGVLVH